MAWNVIIGRKARRGIAGLPAKVKQALTLLMQDLELNGPVRGNWPNYSKLGDRKHHCHLKKGHPTYVAVWVEDKGNLQLIEVIYAGAHEDAPY